MRSVQSLNGLWDYQIADGPIQPKEVPYSDAPVGFAVCARRFDALPTAPRARVNLRLEGITYEAHVTLNGHFLGKMLPYVPYDFDITDILAEKDNLIRVEVLDTTMAFGPAEGWENSSGIIRDVSIVYLESSFIEDVFWHTELRADCADCHAEVTLSGTRADGLRLRLFSSEDGVVFEKRCRPESAADLSFSLPNPRLWSPETPYLYTLEIDLLEGDRLLDKWVRRVGVKELKTVGKRFYLNGKPLFLIGVCRHDLWGDSGHILTRAQMRQDMEMIKHTGANFVRLVHYPHHPYILDLADELGLMVSEEPGLWWSDMKNQEIVDASLEVMRRTVLRDRSHVCVAFWMSFNECIFTPEFLLAAAKLCRENDPVHLVSGANCMDIPMTKKHFAACNLDFYTMHPYAPTDDRMLESARELNDKPLVFSEWGGYHVYNNPDLLGRFLDTMRTLWENPDDQPVLAGAFLWCWAEYFEFSRAAPACSDGVLHEGLVDRFRRPLSNYETFREKVSNFTVPRLPKRSLEILPPQVPRAAFEPVDLTAVAADSKQRQAWEDMMALSAVPVSRFVFRERSVRVMKFGPTLPECPDALGTLPVRLLEKPLVVMRPAAPDVRIPLDERCAALYLVGNVSMPKGFPIGGAFAKTVALCTVEYEDGTCQEFPLRNGQEISTAAGWYGPSRIHPVASHASCVLRFVNDPDRERYVAHLLTVPLDASKAALSVTLSVLDESWALLYYGVTIERA